MAKFLSLKELHRPPSSPRCQTSAQARYLTANTNPAQRLRAVGAKLPSGSSQNQNSPMI
ncbi:MAG: hypothetical protein M3R64_05135 [Pseudomonadota bacterium]|nr:hypothetical protein [Pseudomonadota bacterium]